MKRIVAALLVVLGLGVVASPATASEDEKASPPPEFEYLELDPITLPVITEHGLMQQVNMLISVEVDYGKAEELGRYRPRLVDAYLRDLYDVLGTGYALNPNGAINMKMIKSRLTTITGSILGEGAFRDVLLQAVQQRPM